VQSVGMQNHPSRGSSQHRGQFHNRGQHQQFRGHWHPHRGQFHQRRGQSQDRTQGQRYVQFCLKSRYHRSQSQGLMACPMF
jgi:hypothetical protein